MSEIDWDENLETGVEVIDDDHQLLIKLYNELFVAFFADADFSDLVKSMRKLIEHTMSHFQREEVLMQANSYPMTDAHKQEHTSLLRTALCLQEKLFSDGSGSLEFYTLSFLRPWLEEHILAADMELAQFLLVESTTT